MIDDPIRINKKRRLIKSCQACRSKKLKCEKQKPECSTCLKLGIPCLYYTTPQVKDSYNVDQQIKELEHQLGVLREERSKDVSPTDRLVPHDEVAEREPILLKRPLSLFSLFQKDAYLTSLIRSTRGSGVPSKIFHEFEREKRQNSAIDIVKFDMFQRKIGLYDLIKPHLLHPNLRYLVSHFFETELYLSFPFIIKDNFLVMLNSTLPNDCAVPPFISEPYIYLFLGQLLMVMRIAAVSLYVCGHPLLNQSYAVGPEVTILAGLCLDEIRKPLHTSTLEYIQLSLLLEIYHLYGPESVSFIDDMISLDINRLIRITSISGYNVLDYDSLDQLNNAKRFVWMSLLELDSVKFLNDGTPFSIKEQYHTTELCSLDRSIRELDRIKIDYSAHSLKRYRFIKQFSNLLNSVRPYPVLEDFEDPLCGIDEFLRENTLTKLLQKDSSTIEARAIKTAEFINLIDLFSLSFTVSLHLLLSADLESDAHCRMFERVMLGFNSMLCLTYFLDSKSHPDYNLQSQFGSNFHLIPKILMAQHRALQWQMSLLIRSHLHPGLERLKKVSTTNLRVMLVNFRKNSKYNVYSKRLHMMNSFMTLKNFGIDFNAITSPTFRQLLNSSISPLDSKTDEMHQMAQKSLIELNGDQEVLSSSTFSGPEDDLEIFFAQNGLDTSTIDQLEQFLERQSPLL